MYNGHATASVEPDCGMRPQGVAGGRGGMRPQGTPAARAAETTPNYFNIVARLDGNPVTPDPGFTGTGVNTGANVNTSSRTSHRTVPLSLGATANDTRGATGATVNRPGVKTGASVNSGANGTCVDTGADVNGTCVDTGANMENPIEPGRQMTPQSAVEQEENRNIFIQAETGDEGGMGVGGTEPDVSLDMYRGG